MSDLIGDNNAEQPDDADAIRKKYRKLADEQKYENLSKVPPQLQPHAKRFIDGKSKGLGTSHNQHSISTKYPPEMYNAICTLNDRSDYIRRAVLAQLHKDGLILDYSLPDLG